MGDTDPTSFGTWVPGAASIMQRADVAVPDSNGNGTRLVWAAIGIIPGSWSTVRGSWGMAFAGLALEHS